MRIGIDGRELCGKPTGVGRHLSGLLDEWGRTPHGARHEFVVYAPSHPSVALPPSFLVRIVPGGGGTVWEQAALARAAGRDRLNVFFAPGYSGPLAVQAPIVVLVHDLSFVAHPEWFRPRERLRRRLLTRWSSRKAAAILTVSDVIRDEVVTRFGIDRARVRRIYPGIATIRPAAPISQREPIVLFVGSVFNRRHLPDLIGGFSRLAQQHPEVRLEIVGDDRTYPPQDLGAIAEVHGLRARVSVRSYVQDAELASLYGRASVFAFLSEYEGFGHPPLEALAVRVPPVLLDTAVAREVCGDAALYVANGDVRAIGEALATLLCDGADRSRILDAAPAVLSRYSWRRAAEETLETLEAAGARH